MTIWVLVQVLLNLLFFAGIGAAWIRLKRPPSEDPRLSRGLQILQSKIAILEDLSDRTDIQVKQLNALLESKCVEIQNKITEAEKIIRSQEMSRNKSLEAAKLFEDKIPHHEIVQRQNTVKYVKAARLAHQGISIPEILKQVDLSQAEVEFIAKVNRDHLMFSEEGLPEWIQSQMDMPAVTASSSEVAMTTPVVTPLIKNEIQIDMSADQNKLKQLGHEFQKAVQMAAQTNSLNINPQNSFQVPQQSFVEIKIDAMASTQTGITPGGKTVQVKPFSFPRITT